MAGQDGPARWIRFDEIEIDVAGHRLFVRGAEVPLERKAFAVLVLLASSPGRVLARDEILDAVWGHTHVTPGVLNRVVTLLRQALGDGGETHRYLHTVHGVGYRFDAPLRTALAADAGDTPAGTRAPSSAASPPNETTATQTATAGMHTDAMEAPAPTQTSTRWRRFGWASAALVFVVVAVVAVVALWFHPRAQAPRSSSPVLVVLPLRPVGAGSERASLADGLSEELITRLARVDGISLISTTSASLASAQGLDRSQLATRLHATHALEGSLRQAGNRLRIDLRLVELPSGRTLWASNYDRTVADVLAIESEIAQSVAAALRLKLGLPASVQEVDPEGFREYLSLRWRLLNTAIGRGPERDKFIETLTAFAARYPGYARAHGLLAQGLIIRPFGAAPIPEGDLAQMRREAGRALDLDPRDADALSAITYLACIQRDWERCVDGMHHLVELVPADALVRSWYTSQLGRLGYLERALEQAEIGVASDPLSYGASFQHARVLDTLGRHEQARQEFEAMQALPGATPASLAYARWYNDVWRGDLGGARARAGEMPPEQGFRDSYLAVTDALADPSLWPRALAAIDASESVVGRMNVVRVMAPHPDYARIITTLEKMLRDGWPSYYLQLWMPEYPALRRDPSFQELLKRNGILDYWNAHGLPTQCHREGDQVICP